MNNNPTDILNLISKLTRKRIVNAVKIFSSFYFSRIIRRPVTWGFPISISIEPTTSCNLRCPECVSGLRAFTRPTGMLEENDFKMIVDQLYKGLLYLTFYFQGEPYLNKNFISMVSYASKRKIYTSTSTNGHYLDKETALATVQSGLDRLIISVDGMTQEVYSQYRIGGNIEKVFEGVKNIVDAKKELKSKTPYVVVQCVVTSKNEHQIDDLKTIFKKFGVNKIALKSAQLNDFENGNALIPSDDKYSRYRMNDSGKYSLKNKLYNHCWKLWHSCVITWDKNILPCCFDKDGIYKMGELSGNNFKEIWTSNTYNIFRKSLLIKRKEIEMCTNCTEGTQVWI